MDEGGIEVEVVNELVRQPDAEGGGLPFNGCEGRVAEPFAAESCVVGSANCIDEEQPDLCCTQGPVI